MEGDLLCLPSDMPLSRLQGLFLGVNLPVLCRVGKAELEELYLSPVCPSEPGRLAPLQLCAATVTATPDSGRPRET